LDEEEALKIANIFKQTLVKNVLPPDSRPHERIVKLPLGSSLLHSANVKNESEENSVVEVFTSGACRLYVNFWTILGQAFVGDSPFSPALLMWSVWMTDVFSRGARSGKGLHPNSRDN
jgi:hypothetical protein